MNKTISAIISTRNGEKFIGGCLTNLLCQSAAEDLEIIIIDSASEENEKRIISKYQKKFNGIKYYRTKKKETLYASWNRAIKKASGKYIISTNVDDRSRPDAFRIMTKALDDNPAIPLVYSDYYITTIANDMFDSAKKKSHWLSYKSQGYSHKMLLVENTFGPRPMWRKSIHDELGFFKEDYSIAGDYEFWMRIAERYKMLHIAKPLCLYYINKNTLCGKHKETLKKEYKKIRTKYFYYKT